VCLRESGLQACFGTILGHATGILLAEGIIACGTVSIPTGAQIGAFTLGAGCMGVQFVHALIQISDGISTNLGGVGCPVCKESTTIRTAIDGPSGDFHVIAIFQELFHNEIFGVSGGSPEEMTLATTLHNDLHERIKGGLQSRSGHCCEIL